MIPTADLEALSLSALRTEILLDMHELRPLKEELREYETRRETPQ